ncbi:MAG TPA: hypothetical protein VF384_11030 [Planctomycetota bacterium]
MIGKTSIAVALIAAMVVPASGQTREPVPAPEANAAHRGAAEPAWSFSASVYTTFVPDDREYVVPTFTADRDWLHLELRYNYEDLDTVSAWVGYNFIVEDEISLEFTPMVGGVFGSTNGYAPGYKGTLSWWQLELYSEGEYLFDSEVDSDSFFYSWSELTFAPVEIFRFGLVTERTRLYDTASDIQHGLLVGFSGESFDVTAYLFDPDDTKPIFVLAFGVGF